MKNSHLDAPFTYIIVQRDLFNFYKKSHFINQSNVRKYFEKKRVGIIACNILQLELEKILNKLQCYPEVIFLDSALHIEPKKMRSALIEQINEMSERVDVIFLGYGFCQSLHGIEDDCSIPIILPQVDNCISMLLSPGRYSAEVKKEAGSWFITPGWTKVGVEMVIKELHLDRVQIFLQDSLRILLWPPLILLASFQTVRCRHYYSIQRETTNSYDRLIMLFG
jgi:hypothetical protein